MPNLIESIDHTQFYDPDINLFYDFVDCDIEIEGGLKLLMVNAIIQNENSTLYLLVDSDDNHLSVLRLVEYFCHGSIYSQIKKSYSPVPNEGYGYILYRLVIDFHEGPIISDSYNTLPGSYNLWKKLIKNTKYQVKTLSLNSGRSYSIKNPLNELLIWGVELDYLEDIDSTEWDQVIFPEDFQPIDLDDEYDEDFFVRYLTENEKYSRTMVSDFVVRALRNGKSNIKNTLKTRKSNLYLNSPKNTKGVAQNIKMGTQRCRSPVK
jgi:hypothetical protein